MSDSLRDGLYGLLDEAVSKGKKRISRKKIKKLLRSTAVRQCQKCGEDSHTTTAVDCCSACWMEELKKEKELKESLETHKRLTRTL